MDPIKFFGRPSLHTVDQDTKFSAACILKEESIKDVWDAMNKIWFHPYMGYLDSIHHDLRPQFIRTEWKNLVKLNGIKDKSSGVESLNELGTNKKYRLFMRDIYNNVFTEIYTLTPNNAPTTTVKVVNITAGPLDLVPTILAHSTMPRISVDPIALREQAIRMRAMIIARKEITELSARARIETALAKYIPSASDSDVELDNVVLMYQERPIGRWVRLFVVVHGIKKFKR